MILAHAAMDATDNVRNNLLPGLTQDVASEYHLLRVGVDVVVARALIAATYGRLGLPRQPSSFLTNFSESSAKPSRS